MNVNTTDPGPPDPVPGSAEVADTAEVAGSTGRLPGGAPPGCLGAGAVFLTIAAAGALMGGSPDELLLSSLEVLPFVLLAALAYQGVRHRWAGVLAKVWAVLLVAGVAFLTVMVHLMLFVPRPGSVGGPVVPGAEAYRQVGLVLLLSPVGVLVALLALLPGVRRACARLLPIDPDSAVHTAALAFVVGTTVISFGQLAAASGRPVMLELIRRDAELLRAIQASDLLFSLAWIVPGTFFAVGYPLARSLDQAAERLGLVRPTGRQLALSLALAALLAAAVSILGSGIETVWSFLGWPTTDTAAFEELIRPLITPVGAAVIGVTAGVGEELVTRGALQPRLGIWLPNLFFTGIHAFQYGLDGLVIVFALGMVLGILRARTNTLLACVTHGVYDFILVMHAFLTGSPS